MTNDPIADLLTRIRNANMRRHKSVLVPYAKLKEEIIKILLDEGYILDYKIIGEKVSEKNFKIFLKYKGTNRVITGLKRISKPGLRVYKEANKLPEVLNGYGIAIVSTSKGIMTSHAAKKANLGGEIMAYIW
ncbi:MAG: 30S ribosomal protein S8 [Candidatus Hepatoplasma scabrum]|nr:MAG: 30S ribosomal protein S8 [Candidatus Hepatoplasma sp.]